MEKWERKGFLKLNAALQQVRQDQRDVIKTKDYRHLQALDKKEFRKDQINLLKEFLLTKKLEGCSMITLRDYHDKIMKLIDWTDKDLRELTTKDIRTYLYQYQEDRKVSRSTLDGMRLVISTFYTFMENEDIISKNPVRRIHKIKYDEIVRPPFSDEELETIRKTTTNIRDLAIVDLLYSSGMRIGECVSLNIKDMNFAEREVIVYGKGGKERICYFNARTKIEILEYLQSRVDQEPALFVSRNYPYNRLKKGGVEHMLKKIEEKTGIQSIHPHRFRRTLATNLLDKGMSLEQVQRILGHKKIETTLIYANVNQSVTKMNHQKFTC